MARRIIDRNGTITPKEIDKGIKNIWKWEWLEREVCGELVSRHIQKLGEKGKAFCTLCRKDLSYASQGRKALEQHIQLKVHHDNA
jgi:hypothetical protein